MTACQTARTPLPPLPTDTPLPPTFTPTATIAWFPPTATLTPFPTIAITPTVDIHPELGQLLLKEEFTDPAQWNLSTTDTKSAILGKNELSLALTQPGGYIFSVFQKKLPLDYYIEMTASPNLCRGEDQYGVLLRFTPSQEFYRFSLSCDGRARLDKYFHGTASSPMPWTYSSSIPPGAPSQSRIGVLVKGKEMDFFVNGEFLFSVRDPSIPSGKLGVFARSAGDNAVTINFSDLEIYEAAS